MSRGQTFVGTQLVLDAISLVTIALCTVFKVPQIINVVQLKSSRGINVVGLYLELISYSITLCYNFRHGYAILNYMEYPIVLVQEILLIYYVLHYSRQINAKTLIVCGLYFSVLGAFLVGVLPRGILLFLLPTTIPIGASSKAIAFYEIVHSKNSESVSLLTWLISALTNFARIVTVYFESSDILLLLNFSISTVLSALVLAAAYFFKPRVKKD